MKVTFLNACRLSPLFYRVSHAASKSPWLRSRCPKSPALFDTIYTIALSRLRSKLSCEITQTSYTLRVRWPCEQAQPAGAETTVQEIHHVACSHLPLLKDDPAPRNHHRPHGTHPKNGEGCQAEVQAPGAQEAISSHDDPRNPKGCNEGAARGAAVPSAGQHYTAREAKEMIHSRAPRGERYASRQHVKGTPRGATRRRTRPPPSTRTRPPSASGSPWGVLCPCRRGWRTPAARDCCARTQPGARMPAAQ